MEMRNKTHRLFGERASRITTQEMKSVYWELFEVLCATFLNMRLTESLKCKKDHGDIDIVYCMFHKFDPETKLKNILGKNMLEYSENGDVASMLYHSDTIKKDVHVDFILATVENYRTKLQYFSYNDFSGIVGILAKKYDYKYGSEGFFKRFKDCAGNWHDLLVSHDLMDGLRILGYDPDKYDALQTYDDIVTFMLSSEMFDYRFFEEDELNQSDRKSMKRPVVEYVVKKLRESGKVATVTNDGFYYAQLDRDGFVTIIKQCLKINREIEEQRKHRKERMENTNVSRISN